MSILVVGGTGFIGQRVIRRLVALGEHAIAFDLSPRFDEFATDDEHVTLVGGDATHFDDLAQTIIENRVERIINLAYMLGEGERQPHRAMQVNVIAMDNTFEATRLFNLKRTVYASSIAYHGPSQKPFGDRAVTEDDLGYPGGVYTACKQFNEAMAAQYVTRYGSSLVALRPPFVIGPAKPRGVLDVVNIMVQPALGHAVSSPLREDARFVLGHVEDVADMFVHLALAEAPHYAVYHAGGHSATAGDLAKLVREAVPEAIIAFDPNGYGGFLVNHVDNSRIVAEFKCEHRPLPQLVNDIMTETRRFHAPAVS